LLKKSGSPDAIIALTNSYNKKGITCKAQENMLKLPSTKSQSAPSSRFRIQDVSEPLIERLTFLAIHNSRFRESYPFSNETGSFSGTSDSVTLANPSYRMLIFRLFNKM
jgi:hypothetical protein